ncbi:MAG: hypothetical protein GF421_02830 [Candidatus Aminicenantes bacterium]|nr:hypothetical protein [Candidatus Aminicenantes bacterium]
MAGLSSQKTLGPMKMKGRVRVFLLVFLCLLPEAGLWADAPQIELKRDESSAVLRILINSTEKLVYQYHISLDLVHYWPLKSPSGKDMLIQKAEPYPHHRAFWFADTVRLNRGREVSFYNALYSGRKIGENTYGSPFCDHIRHVRFTCLETKGNIAVIKEELIWEMDGDVPVMDEHRKLRIYALGQGEYYIDISFQLTASYGDVEFISDEVHYAWPYLRMHPQFSGKNGGEITSDQGNKGQKQTNMEYALWVDYSNTIKGQAEGLAVFQWPDGKRHRWLTREYGTFGPRRPDLKSGQPFALEKGETLSQRVGILVHRGNAITGKVKQRYQELILQKKRNEPA